jgi:hypothetical protein
MPNGRLDLALFTTATRSLPFPGAGAGREAREGAGVRQPGASHRSTPRMERTARLFRRSLKGVKEN